MHLVGNIEALQQNRGVRFGGVAVFLADDAFEFAEFHSVRVRQFRFRIDDFAFFESGPQAAIAHDDRIDDAILIEGKLILAQNSQLARADDGSLLRFKFTGEKLHERGFTRPIGTGEAVALPRNKAGGNFVEQNFGAVAHGHITD